MTRRWSQRVAAANAASAQVARAAGSFARGLVIGEPDDLVGFAGTALGDVFVFGDIRDALREGSRLASGQPADELILGLACVGLAVTAGTYATLGAGAPARVGPFVDQGGAQDRPDRRRISPPGRDGRCATSSTARRSGAPSLARPGTGGARGARAPSRSNKADGLVRFVGDVGRVQGKAGTQRGARRHQARAGPRDMARVAELAEAKGSQTRAILKTAGPRRHHAWPSAHSISPGGCLWALLSLLGFVSSLKATVRARHLALLRRPPRQAPARARPLCGDDGTA